MTKMRTIIIILIHWLKRALAEEKCYQSQERAEVTIPCSTQAQRHDRKREKEVGAEVRVVTAHATPVEVTAERVGTVDEIMIGEMTADDEMTVDDEM